MEVLTNLAANLNDQVWLITSKEVSELETTYGKIPGLNLAGKKGADLSPSNTLKLELPDISTAKDILRDRLIEISSSKPPIQSNR
jgi:trehalose-6-phosphatase